MERREAAFLLKCHTRGPESGGENGNEIAGYSKDWLGRHSWDNKGSPTDDIRRETGKSMEEVSYLPLSLHRCCHTSRTPENWRILNLSGSRPWFHYLV